MKYFYSTILFLVMYALPNLAFAQAAQETFGKSRVQYKQFNWQYLSSNNFEIFYYGNNKKLATNAIWHAEAEFVRITELIGFAPYIKTKLYIYASKSDMLQSNVGLDVENNMIVGGKTSFTKSIVEVPFAGDNITFRREISKGIAKILIYDMLYGGSLKEVLQSTFLLTLPDWFIEGAMQYVAEGWSTDMDNIIRDMMLNKKIKKPSLLMGQHAVVAGQSIWNFIAVRYGKSNIANILNLTRIIRNEEASISNTLGVRYSLFTKEWRDFYLNAAEKTNNETTMPAVKQRIEKIKKTQEAHHLTLNASGTQLAYTTHENGISKIHLIQTNNKKHKVIYSKGYQLLSQTADEKLPILAWLNDNTLLWIDYQKGDNYLTAYNINSKKKQKRKLNFEQVHSFSASKDGKTLVLSAVRKGETNIFLYNNSSGRVKAVTNDLYDDLYPSFLPNGAIVFSSNRPPDSLKLNVSNDIKANTLKDNLSLFLIENEQLKSITKTPFQHTQAKAISDQELLFLSNDNGIFNLKKYNFTDSSITTLTNYRQSIKYYAYQDGQLAIIMRNDLKENIYYVPLSTTTMPRHTTYRQDLIGELMWEKNNIQKPIVFTDTTIEDTSQKVANTDEIDFRNYIFESEKISPQKNKINTPLKAPLTFWQDVALPKLIIDSEQPYKNRLAAGDLITNPILIDPLRGWSMSMQANMTDIFENHKIKAGALVNIVNLRSNDYFLEYEFLKKRIDYGAKYFRKSIYYEGESAIIQRYNLNQFEGSATYPLSVSSRIKASPTLAITRMLDMTQPATLNSKDITRSYVGGKLEYIFDNTTAYGLNMYAGTRAKAGIRYLYETADNTRSFGSVNVDVRHYQKVHQEIVLALRLAYGSFFGNAPKSFLLGGMDNWIFRKTEEQPNEDNPLHFTPTNSNNDQKADWLFMEYVTNMRGFKYNTLYGHSYLLFNAELRIPMVRYLYNGPISSSFFRNLQLTAFTDIGSAWTGENPFNQNNNFNTRIIRDEQAGFTITVINYRNPFLTGYGFGLRTLVFNYYVKTDFAWGIKDYNPQTPMLYLTLGYDF